MPIELNMTDTYIQQAKQIAYTHNKRVWHQDDNGHFVFVFSFLDKDQKEILAPTVVEISIVNDKGETVFAGTRAIYPYDFQNWYYSDGTVRNQATVYIWDGDITPGSSSSGTFYYKIYTPGIVSFKQASLKISEDLPCA